MIASSVSGNGLRALVCIGRLAQMCMMQHTSWKDWGGLGIADRVNFAEGDVSSLPLYLSLVLTYRA